MQPAYTDFSLAVNCGILENPANGIVDTTSGTTFMNTATYTCDSGYTLNGAKSRTCQSNRTWDITEPFCESKIA